MFDEQSIQDIITCLLLAEKPELVDYFTKLVKKIYPELKGEDTSDEDYSIDSGSASSEEHYGYSVDDEGLLSLK